MGSAMAVTFPFAGNRTGQRSNAIRRDSLVTKKEKNGDKNPEIGSRFNRRLRLVSLLLFGLTFQGFIREGIRTRIVECES